MDHILAEIEDRRSIRKFKAEQVCDEDILRLIEAARLAPSGSNTQPSRFMIIKEEETKKKIVAADHNQAWMLTAPVFIVCLADISCRADAGKTYVLEEDSCDPELKMIIRDAAIGISYLLLEAQHIGLGACWTAWFEQKDMKAALNIPDNFYITGVVPVGYADEAPKARPRMKLEDMIYKG